MTLRVGGSEQPSGVYLSQYGIFFEARPGVSAYGSGNFNGGDGYSGGGALTYTNSLSIERGSEGGTNGLDGQDGKGDDDWHCIGGHGSGEDISSYTMENFVLTPGMGGKSYMSHATAGVYPGGGGGGVVVNGLGPYRCDNQGEGYGGGNGLPGVILLEIGNY